MANRKRKCPFCKEFAVAADMLIINNQAFCNYDHVSKYAVKNRLTSYNVRRKEQKRESAARKRELNAESHSHQIYLTQKEFNKFIRVLDAHQDCVSCGKLAGTYTLTAGHYKTVGARSELRFDTRNCHAQCSGCNSGRQKFNKGDDATTSRKFRAEIIRRYGIGMVEASERDHTQKHYTIDQLKLMRETLSAERRWIEKGNAPTRNWRAESGQPLTKIDAGLVPD